VSGTAVKGTALGGAAVSVKCAVGSGTATTTSGGIYAITITGGALPCVVRVSASDGTNYHSVVPGTGNTGTFTANVSPLTEMIVAHAARADPAQFFNAFGSTSAVTAASVTAATAYVQTAMAGLADLSGSKPVTDPLSVGDPLDQKTDQVMAGLASAGVSVAQVTAAIVANPVAPSVVATPLAPSTASCSWMKSGKYRILRRSETDPNFRFKSVTFDAATLTFRDTDNTTIALTAAGACQFTMDDPDETVKLIASSGGWLVMHALSKVGGAPDLFFAIPEQSLPLAELAGAWNAMSWDPSRLALGGQSVVFSAEASIDGTGQVTAANSCVGLACKTEPGPFVKFTSNGLGGFDLVQDGAVVGRAFLYKTLGGQKALALLDNRNGLTVFVTKQPLALPAVDSMVNSTNAGLFIPLNGTAEGVTAPADSTIRITAVNAVAGTVVRLRVSDNRVDVHSYNKPVDGLRHRPYATCTIFGVPTVPACAEGVYMPLPGMGVTLSMFVAAATSGPSFEFSVGKP
jgi:hypothetical protein